MTPKKEAALSRKTVPEPVASEAAAAITRPPSAGPTARATLNPAEFSATPAGKRSGETISGVMACQAGSFITAPSPSKKVNSSRIQGVTTPRKVSRPRVAAASTIQDWVKINRRRRSTTSASAPAGRITRKTGRLLAACTRLTIRGERLSEVISQPRMRHEAEDVARLVAEAGDIEGRAVGVLGVGTFGAARGGA